MMESSQPALPMRDHTVLGVCEALGEDFGFNPLWLRILFASTLIWHPLYVVGTYLALGLVVLVSRLLVPVRRAAPGAGDVTRAEPAEMAIAA
jgi:phage shock protein PspC (stress-responsive transcriptional regulator)